MNQVKPLRTGHLSGTIKSTDAPACNVTLETGRIYQSEAKLSPSAVRSDAAVNEAANADFPAAVVTPTSSDITPTA